MAYASATKAQAQALRDALVNGTKIVERVQEGGQSNAETLGPDVDTSMEAVVAALAGIGASSGGTSALVSSGTSVSVPVTFTTAREAGATATVAVTLTVADGAISAVAVA